MKTRAELLDAINAWSAGTGDLARLMAALGAHETAARVEALREASRWLLDHAEAVASGDNRINPRVAAKLLRARADEIEGGER